LVLHEDNNGFGRIVGYHQLTPGWNENIGVVVQRPAGAKLWAAIYDDFGQIGAFEPASVSLNSDICRGVDVPTSLCQFAAGHGGKSNAASMLVGCSSLNEDPELLCFAGQPIGMHLFSCTGCGSP